MTYKIKTILVKRFRSLFDIALTIDTNVNTISICGGNNTGKTNILRAINLFFHPEKYEPKEDKPFHKVVSGGGSTSTSPEIIIGFVDSNSSDIYTIARKFDSHDLVETTGKKNTDILSEEEVIKFLKQIKLFYIESINVSFPQLINSAIEDVYEGKYSNTRLSGAKKQVKDSYSEYLSSLQEILQELSSELTSLFSIYNQEWKVDFRYEGSLSKFVDLISDDVKVHINDGSNLSIEGKGSGLQRLAYILLNYFVARQISSQSSIIFMVDEPDVYLHHGLQKKLKDNLLDISQNHQVFLTTHSPVFIDTYNLKNVFLLDILREEVQYKRKPNEVFYKLNTTLVSMNQIDGINKIRNYLGLDELDANNLSPCNFLVEGEADKIYIESLCGFFNIPCPQIEIATGANNMPKMLDYFESISTNQSIKPKILVLLDNDSKGREIYPKITLSKFTNIVVSKMYTPNFLGETPEYQRISNTPNIEIEDFIYPKLLAYCANDLLARRTFTSIAPNELESKILTNARKEKGILESV